MKAIIHKVDGKCKQGQLRMKWREQVKGNMRRIGADEECRSGEQMKSAEVQKMLQIDAGGEVLKELQK